MTVRQTLEKPIAERTRDEQLLTLKEARERRLRVGFKPSDIEHPAFLGLRKVELPLEQLMPYIDWRSFRAEELDRAKALLDEIAAGQLLQARGVYGFWPALTIGDDIVVYRAESLREEIARYPMLRQQSDRGAGEHTTSLADFIAPKQSGLTDFLGAFAVTAGLGVDQLAMKYEPDDNDSAALVRALAERLTEAFAENLHARVRREFGYGHDEQLSAQDIPDQRYRGIRPAFGSPACPDHTDRRTLFAMLGAREVGMDLTEQLAMTPSASVAGLYFAHPKAHYFRVGALAKDQVEDYAMRKRMDVREVERWLQSSLAYDPE